jgi:hypothetical protein
MAAGDVTCSLTNPTSTLCNSFGAGNYVEIPHNAAQLGANLSNGFTISAWIYPRSVGQTAGRILDKATTVTATDGFSFFMQANRVGFLISDGTIRISGISSIVYNNWYHALVTIASDAKISFYINGVLSGTVQDLNALNTIINTGVMRIGNRANSTDRTFDGGIRQVKMWGKVLSATEIAQDYAGVPVTDALIHHFKLGGDYTDYGGVGVTATNSGSIATNIEDTFEKILKARRKTANDKYIADEINGKIFLSHIEEAA